MKTARLELRISEDLKNALERRARIENRKISNLVEFILKKEMGLLNEFISFADIGYDEEYYDNEGVKHLDNRFIGVFGHDGNWELAYCDSVTGEIFPQDIFDKDGNLIDVNSLEI